MPKANWWLALQVGGKQKQQNPEHRMFDDLSLARAWVSSHSGVVLLGGKTPEAAAAKAHGRVPPGTLFPVHVTLPRNRGAVTAAHTVLVPSHGPVTVDAKRAARRQKRIDAGLPAVVEPTRLGGSGISRKRSRSETKGDAPQEASTEGTSEAVDQVAGAVAKDAPPQESRTERRARRKLERAAARAAAASAREAADVSAASESS